MNNPTVEHWNVEIQVKSLDVTGQKIYRNVKSVEIWGSYFTQVPKQFVEGDYYLHVTGLNAVGDIVSEEGPIPVCPGCPTDGQACSTICEGTTYAWQGAYFADGNGGNFALSNFLSASAFPVPIDGDEFSLKLQAFAKLKFDYVLYDLNGTELYRKNFVIQKDHNLVHNIKVHDGIPEGNLVNKFIFEDGSELVFQTMK